MERQNNISFSLRGFFFLMVISFAVFVEVVPHKLIPKQIIEGESKVDDGIIKSQDASSNDSDENNSTYVTLDDFAYQVLPTFLPQLDFDKYLHTNGKITYVERKDAFPLTWHIFPSLFTYIKVILTYFLAPNAP